MRYIAFIDKSFNGKSQETIGQADDIIKEYVAKGYTLTLRQLYYQFVARGLIENTERSYKNLGNIVNDARYAGLLPWDGIEDRGREYNGTYCNEDMQECFENIAHHYAVDLWERQPYYVEAWIEKEALSNVLSRPCGRFRVPYMSCKGYLSASAAWRAGERFEEAAENGKKCVLIHLGDHDPSGLDMTRDNGARLALLSRQPNIKIRRVALNMNQVRQYSPPPNPTKISDSRATDYIKKFGNSSWELDALEPEVIADLVTKEIRSLIDMDIWNESLSEEEEKRVFLKRFYDEFESIEEFLNSK